MGHAAIEITDDQRHAELFCGELGFQCPVAGYKGNGLTIGRCGNPTQNSVVATLDIGSVKRL